MNGRLKLLIPAVLSATLAACGAGGTDSADAATPTPPPQTPKGSSGDSGTLDSATYTGGPLVIFNAINEARAQAGLAPVKQNTKLDKAAQGHAGYIHLNGNGEGHAQTAGKPGYTGSHPGARIGDYHAYSAGEVIGYNTEDAVTSLMSTVYHRLGLLSAETVDLGIGISTFAMQGTPNISSLVTVINYGKTSIHNALPHETGYWTWPFNGANNLAVGFAENPSPAPDLQTLGHAISITVTPGDRIDPEVFTVNCAGQDLPARIITAANDLNDMIPANWVFLQPEAALPHDSTCTATFQGVSRKLGRLNKNWSFTTAGQ